MLLIQNLNLLWPLFFPLTLTSLHVSGRRDCVLSVWKPTLALVMQERQSAGNIKKLSVCYDCELLRGEMSFHTPSLVYLSYRDYALQYYRDVNLASLVEARLAIHYSKWIKDSDLRGLIIGVSKVEILHLSPASADVIARCVEVEEDGLVLPVFKNLVKLTFGSYNERGWKLLPYLIKQSPKLETLIIQGLDGCAGDVTIRPFQVKMLHDLGYGGTTKVLEHLKSFLE